MPGHSRTRTLRTVVGAVVAAALTACTSTERFAAEYKQAYYLAEDVNLYTSTSFTGPYSVWISGPQKVETICSATIPVPGSTVLKKGCPVTVLKLFTINAVDASYSEAKLRIADTASTNTHLVYVKWPGSKSLLTALAPDR